MDNRILEVLRSTLLTRQPLEDLPDGVWKRVAALNTWGTNAIEGNTLTWDDVEQLLLEDRTVAGRPVADVLETLQHEQAFRSLMARRKSSLTLVTALELHEAVFRGVGRHDAGQWRRVNVRIAGTSFRPPSMEKVVPEMERWLAEFDRRDRDSEDTFTLGAWMHHRFEAIHPFADGNGRVGRLLLNLHFLRRNWPPMHIGPNERKRYLDAMEAGHRGDLAPVVDFLQGAMGSSLLDMLDMVGTEQDRLRPLPSLGKKGGYSGHYLALRALQGELPAVKVKGRWSSSRRALSAYAERVGRR